MPHFQLAALMAAVLSPILFRRIRVWISIKVGTYEQCTKTNDQAALHYSVQTTRQYKATKDKTSYDKDIQGNGMPMTKRGKAITSQDHDKVLTRQDHNKALT
jgi:hypothetical protein